MSLHQSLNTDNAAPISGPLPFVPRLLSAELAALYVGISKSNFLARVTTHEIPQPRRLGKRVLWDRHTLDAYIDALFGIENAEAAEANDFGD